MASRNLGRGANQEHQNAKRRLQDARETRSTMEDRREAATRSGEDEVQASVALRAAEEQLAAREAWVKWVERDY